MKKSIPYGQALRLRRVCSDLAEFANASKNLKSRLINRGYSEKEITAQIDQAKTKNRDELLQYRPKEPSTKIPFVLTYNPS